MKHHHLRRIPAAAQGFTIMELLVVVAICGIMAAVALPMARPAVQGYAVAGQAHSVAYGISLAKMRAAADFTQARLYVDLGSNSYRIESWDKTASAWTTQGAVTTLPSGIGFGFGTLADAPPNTQGTIGQAPACTDKCAGCAGAAAIDSTSCVFFNSRGAPIDATGSAIASDALYITDGSVVYGVTVSLSGLAQLWWTPTYRTSWQKQ